jgi:hypothetical protein
MLLQLSLHGGSSLSCQLPLDTEDIQVVTNLRKWFEENSRPVFFI